MAHQLQLEKAKYRQWAKAGLGLGYLKEGLSPFCHDIANQQHKDILDNIQQTKSLPLPVTCGTCQLRSIKPDHVKAGNKVCPYGQVNCNCWFSNGKIVCQKRICGAIYDHIIQSHASTPPAPNWKNTDSQLWTADPWSIAKCYINAPGYDQKTSAADTDCTGLLNMIINNRYFHNHIACDLTRPSNFSKVPLYRNEIFHSSSLELDEKTANSYIDDMISILQDGKELINHPDSKIAVLKLQDLKNKDFVITSESFEELLKQIREEMANVLKSTNSTKEECERLKINLSHIETLMLEQKEEMIRLRVGGSPEQKQLQYEKAKADLQRQMIDRYRETLLQVPVLPLIPGTNKCSFSEIYIRPRITHEVKGEKGDTKEKEVKSMSEIFTKNGFPLKSIYVVGDAGTGKSSFCKYLVNCWCMAHSEENQAENIANETDKKEPDNDYKNDEADNLVYETGNRNNVDDNESQEADNVGQETDRSDSDDGNENHEDDNVSSKESEDESSEFESGSDESDSDEYDAENYETEFNGVQEMRKFDFLFHIALRRYQNVVSIHEMLKNHYDSKILDELLENESGNIIILLDGLDEWSSESKTQNQSQTEGLPEQGYLKNYTIVTTSRPWKIHSLNIDDTEIQQLLKLKGFDGRHERIMICRTVSYINSQKEESKDSYDCFEKLEEESLRSLKEVPILLQQLICLWFDGKLDKTLKCAVFTGMLELFFTWNEDKGTGKCTLKPMKVDLPQYLTMKRKCKSNSDLIYDMSRLAYETLFKCTKDRSLTFDIDLFYELEIFDEIRESCLKLGILTEDKCPSLSVSEPPSSMFSFIHKSVQEFLAAVNIAINFKIKMKSSARFKREDIEDACTQFANGVLQNCSTVNEILEQSNVVILLSGLEPSLASHVSKYIYDIVKEDPLVKRYRRTIDSDIGFFNRDYDCIRDIQNLIFDSMKECNSCLVENRATFFIGNLYIIDRNENCDIVCSSFDQQQITPDFIHSIYVDNINTKNVKFLKYLPKFKHLEKINIDSGQLWSISTENVDIRIDEVKKYVVETIKINASSLKSLSLCYDDSLYKEVVCLLPSMINLVAIKMSSITMSHDDTIRFCEFLEGACQLEQIYICIECKCRNQHDVDLSKHQQLQYLDLSNRTCICVTDFDTVNLEIFKCQNIKNTNYIKIFDCFMKCDNLKELELCVDYFNMTQSFYTSIRERLVSVLPLLHNLSMLTLYSFRLTDNIIQVPSEMKSLKIINLSDVIMSLTTWRKFIDSLPSIPHTVNVMLDDCYITGDGEEFNFGRLSLLEGVVVGGEKGNEAKQYVKDREHLFIVNNDYLSMFRFSTKK